MRRKGRWGRWPSSMAGRTVLLLVLGLTLSHAASMLFYAHDREALQAVHGGREFAHRAATLAQVLAAVPASDRNRVVEATKTAHLSVSVETHNPLVDGHVMGWRAGLTRDLLQEELGPGYQGKVVVQVLEPSAGEALARAAMGLPDGTWLVVSGGLPDGGAVPNGGALVSTAIMFAGVLGVSVVVVRRMSRPLEDLARAAERLGRNVAAPPLVEEGPEEVRHAVAAFNTMQDRLRRFVEDRTRMLAAISHDLRTPITLLRLRAEFIEDEEELEKTLATLAEMEEMIGATLAFAREDAESEETQRVDMGALVESLCEDLAEAGKPVTLSGNVSSVISCRPRSLRRAMSNLIENAVRYGDTARVTLNVVGSSAVFQVDDEGPGIPEDRLDDVFRPFFRLEESRGRETGGVGLGLGIVASAAHAHGGEVVLRNRADGGLCATLTIPVA